MAELGVTIKKGTIIKFGGGATYTVTDIYIDIDPSGATTYVDVTHVRLNGTSIERTLTLTQLANAIKSSNLPVIQP